MSLALDAAELAKLPPPEVDSVESSPVESCDEEYERSAVAALIVLSSLAEQHATAQGVVPCRRTPSTEWESAGSQSDSPRVVRRKLGDGAAASALCSRGDAQTLKHSNRIQPSPALVRRRARAPAARRRSRPRHRRLRHTRRTLPVPVSGCASPSESPLKLPPRRRRRRGLGSSTVAAPRSLALRRHPVAPPPTRLPDPPYAAGCGKFYASTDAVRKHCRKRHTEWLGQLEMSKPELYCRWSSGSDESVVGVAA